MSTEGQLQKVPEPQYRQPKGSFLVSALWGLSGALIGVVLGAAGVGHNILQQLTPEARHQREVSQLTGRVEELRKDIATREKELVAERQERKEAVSSLKQSLEGAERNALAAASKGEFLTRLVAYEQTKSEAARGHLIDAVCSMRNQGAVSRITVVRAPLEVSAEELRAGVRPELEQVLLQGGATAELLARVRRTAAQAPLPAVTPYNVSEVQRAAQIRRAAMRDTHEAFAALQRLTQNIDVVRAVRFADGAEVAIPRDIAVFARARKDCAPG